MGTLADSLFNVLMGWVRALVNGIWALFTTDHTTLLEFLGKNWIMIVVVILAAGLAIDWLVWLIRWRPYHLWAKRARRFLHLPEPEEEETGRRKKRPETGEATQKMQTVEAPEEDAFEDEEQWLPLQQPQMDERQAQEVCSARRACRTRSWARIPACVTARQAGERPIWAARSAMPPSTPKGPGAAEVERRRAEIDAWQQQMAEEARQKAEAGARRAGSGAAPAGRAKGLRRRTAPDGRTESLRRRAAPDRRAESLRGGAAAEGAGGISAPAGRIRAAESAV